MTPLDFYAVSDHAQGEIRLDGIPAWARALLRCAGKLGIFFYTRQRQIWSTLLELSNGGANGTFATATTATASVSNNPNFRLRFQMSGKGKGDHCHGDEIRVRGTP